MENLGPEISIVPVRKKPPIKIKKFLENNDSQNISQEVSKSNSTHLFTEHYSRRNPQPLEKCPICKQYFRRIGTHMRKHDNIKVNSEDMFTCKFCSKTFATYMKLGLHIRIHTGERPYVCEICNKGFTQSCNLVNHMRIHTGERPYKCPYCDRAFTQSGNLSNHIRLHTDEKPFSCHFCDKAFAQSGNLSSHIRNNHKYEYLSGEFPTSRKS